MKGLPSQRTFPGHPFAVLAFLTLGLHGPGCGPEDPRPTPSHPPGPEQVISCDDLHLGDPRTGGRFSCTGCSRQWQWPLQEPAPALYVLSEFSCLATTGAWLSLLDPHEIPVWETVILTGDSGRVCIPVESAPAGLYRLRLAGSPAGDRITSFSGSVWINVYNHRGERMLPADGGHP